MPALSHAERQQHSLQARLVAVIVALGSGGVLAIASGLTPSDAGHGSHQQLGLPQCGWVAALDKPCPTCGMTTAFANAAEGSLLSSIQSQPLGFVLAVLTAATFWASSHAAIAGVRLERLGLGRVLLSKQVLFAGLGLGLAAWGYKLATWH